MVTGHADRVNRVSAIGTEIHRRLLAIDCLYLELVGRSMVMTNQNDRLIPGSPEALMALAASKAAAKAAMKAAKAQNPNIYFEKETHSLPPEELARLAEIAERVIAEAAVKSAAALTIEQIAEMEPWQLTKLEHLRHPKAATVAKSSILYVNPSTYTYESLSKHSHRDLKALAQVIGANRSGSKSDLIDGIIIVWNLRKRLSIETIESLSSLSKKDIDELLDQAGCGKYGSRKVKAATLLNWKNYRRDEAKRLISEQNHIIRVRRALEDGFYHQAILSGQMTIERTKEIIVSAGLDAPADLATPESYKPIVRKVKPKQLLLPFMFD